LDNVKAIITGADQGFGKAIAKEFVSQGASVCICSRNPEKLIMAVTEIERYKKRDTQKIISIKADIGIYEEVNDLYRFALEEFGMLNCVVNNAGIYGPIGATIDIDWGKLEQVVRINLMGTLYSMRKAVAAFKEQKAEGRIINLSGGGATAPMPNFMGYAITKAAIVRATETMARETEKDRIYINAVAPGALNTRLLDQVLEAGEEAVGEEFYQKSLKQKENGGASLEQAARLVAYLASGASGELTGKLISAVWDNWDSFSDHLDALKGSDIFTLRRIVPSDRGFSW